MKNFSKSILIVIAAAALGAGLFFLLQKEPEVNTSVTVAPDGLFGWKFPDANFKVASKFPSPAESAKNLFDFQIAFSSIRDPGGIPRGLPVRLSIPEIGVDSAIEDALITPDGRMDVPAGSVNVAWFALGPHPGAVGSAVIGGHFGIRNGAPFVFYKLDNLVVGDKVYITDDRGDTLAFQVRSIKLFDRNADATTVFTSDDGLAHLNLITCEGIWNQVNGSYPSRRVVFTDAIPLLPITAIPTPLPALTPTSIPPTTPTPSPIPNPPPSPNPSPSSPSPTPGSAPAESSSTSLKTLFATPFDGIITSALLLLILFMIFEIIRIRKNNPHSLATR